MTSKNYLNYLWSNANKHRSAFEHLTDKQFEFKNNILKSFSSCSAVKKETLNALFMFFNKSGESDPISTSSICMIAQEFMLDNYQWPTFSRECVVRNLKKLINENIISRTFIEAGKYIYIIYGFPSE